MMGERGVFCGGIRESQIGAEGTLPPNWTETNNPGPRPASLNARSTIVLASCSDMPTYMKFRIARTARRVT